MTRVRPFARVRAVAAALGVVLLTLSAAGAVILVTGQAASALPGDVTIDSPQAGGVFTLEMTFSGTGNPGDLVTLSEGGGNQVASNCTTGVVVDSSGSWSCDWTFERAGTATVTATQTGINDSTIDVNLDVATPLIPATTSPGRYATNITTAASISGSGAAPGYSLGGTFTGPGGDYTCSGLGGSGGIWTCTSASVLPAGEYTFQASEGVGDDTATSDPIVYRAQPGNPASSPTFSTPYDQTTAAHDVKIINALTTTMSGVWIDGGQPETHAKVEVDFGDSTGSPGNYIANAFGGTFCTTTTDDAGAWSCSGPATAFQYGHRYGISIFGLDEAGAVGPSPDGQFGLDVLTPPVAPSAAVQYTNTTTVELDGTGVPGALFSAAGGGQSCSTMVLSGGQYECVLTITPDVPGSYALTLTQATNGDTSAGVGVTVVLDETPPAAPAFSSPWNGSGQARAVVTTGNPTFSGSGDPGGQVFVWGSPDSTGYPADVTPDALLCSGTVQGDGSWSCSVSEPALTLGSYSVGATQWDAAGNNSPSVTPTFELYVDALPAVPTITTPEADSASHLRSGDPVTFSGAAASGDTVKVVEGGALLCQSPVVGGAWSCSIPTLTDGSHTVSASAVDGLGVASVSVSRTFTVEPKAIGKTPLTFTISITDADGNPLDGTDLTPGEAIILVSTGLPPDSTVAAELHSTPYDLGSTTVAGDGTFKLKTRIPADVDPGDHEFSVTVTPPGETATTITSHTSVVPVVVTTTDSATQQPQADGAGAPPIGQRPDDGFDSPSSFASTLPAFGNFPITATTVAVTGGIALAFLLLVAFPSELLEDTVRENYDRAFAWLTPVRRRVEHLRGRVGRMLRNPRAGIALSVLATSVILGFADPSFGFTGASLRLLIGMIISVAAINIGISLLVMRVARREYGDTGYLRPMPGALVIVALSVIVSRFAHISPGFLFGVVMGVAYARELKIAQEAKLAVLSAAFTIAAGILAWLGFSALQTVHGSGFWYQLGLETLVAITLEAIGTMIIAMLPLTFLDGKTIFRWNKWVWAGIYLVTVVVFAVVVLPISDNWGAMTAPIFGWGTLFIVFAVIAFGTWAVFRFMPRRAHADETSMEAEGEPVEGVGTR
ncbi:MAG TPA: FGLLP motif-containing membrane protein [Pseudolysinimonas sp.]|jgi:hypothetical protein